MARFTPSTHYQHGDKQRTGILITNLGTPAAPTAKALRPYLKEFLWDRRVVEIPRALWWLILNGIILRLRPRKSADAYRTVWTDEGSPLAVILKQQCEALKIKLQEHYGDDVRIEWAMRYGQPSVKKGIQSLIDQGASRLLVFPLYPQYSGTTTASTFDAVAKDYLDRRWIPELRFVNHYADHDAYIEALASSVREHWEEYGQPQKLVMSYHGLPQRYLHQGDPYHCYCQLTSRLLAEKLGLSEDDYMVSFQSLFGKAEWLRPYTADKMKTLPAEGVKDIQIICPGFSADCLETIEEIEEENKDYFMEAGGESFSYIPALNTRKDHIDMMMQIIESNLGGWQLASKESEQEATKKAYKKCPRNHGTKP